MPLHTPPPEHAGTLTSIPASTSTSETIQSHPGDAHPHSRGAEMTAAIPGIEDEDIITITTAEDAGSAGRFKILSLVLPPPPHSENNDEGSSNDSNEPPFQLRTTLSAKLPEALLDRLQLSTRPSHLEHGTSVHILISTLSGTGLANAFFGEVLKPCLQALGLHEEEEYTVVRTESEESVTTYARDVLSGGAEKGERQTVVLLSGDGGVFDVVNGLVQSGRVSISSSYRRPNIVLLPFGTGNALFHSLHAQSPLPSIYVQSLRTLLNGSPRPLPLFRASFSPGARILTDESRTATPLPEHNLAQTQAAGTQIQIHDEAQAPVRALYGAVVASYGLHSTLVADSDTPEYRRHGDKRFGLVAKDLLFPEGGAPPHAYSADVTLRKKSVVGGEAQEEKIPRISHGYLLLTLVSNLERKFTISPDSEPLDGKLRIVYFGPVSGERAMGIMTRAYDGGKHVEEEEVGYESVEGIRVEFREEGEDWRWRRCCVDGVIVGVEEGGWMDVRLVEGGREVVDVVVD